MSILPKGQPSRLVTNAAQILQADLSAQIERAHDAGSVALADERIVRPVNLAGGWQEVRILVSDLITLGAAGYVAELRGEALMFCNDGSIPGVLVDFDFGGGGTMLQARPGHRYNGKFSKVTIRINASNLIVQGTVRFLISRNPNATYEENPSAFPGNPGEFGVTGLYNSVVNVPTLITQGKGIEGARGGKVLVDAGSATTITGGSVVLWYWDFSTAVWYPTDMEYQLVLGARYAATSDFGVLVPYGRLFPELRSFTTAAGSGSATVRMNLWRQGQP